MSVDELQHVWLSFEDCNVIAWDIYRSMNTHLSIGVVCTSWTDLYRLGSHNMMPMVAMEPINIFSATCQVFVRKWVGPDGTFAQQGFQLAIGV